MSSYDDTSTRTSPRNSLSTTRSETPDILEPSDIIANGASGGFNLADELAMAEEDCEQKEDVESFLSPLKNNTISVVMSDYEGSEYGNIDDDSDGYLSDHIDIGERQLHELAVEVTGKDMKYGIIRQFVDELRGMRGQMEVENNTWR
jgi:hypothetical protein